MPLRLQAAVPLLLGVILAAPLAADDAGLEFFEKLQLPSGHWGCEYGGPMFLLPGLVIAWYVTKTPIPWYFATRARRARRNGAWAHCLLELRSGDLD